jgi:adenylate kinase
MADEKRQIILFGPPGAGKSTQAALLVKRWPLVAISTGKMLREEVAADSELGRKVRDVLARGELIDDELMVEIMRAWLKKLPPDKGFLLDGFPRTLPQAEALDGLLTELNIALDAVIKLNLSVSEAVHRLGGRRICYGVGAEEIIHINDEAAVGHCLERGGLLVQRADDLPNVIVHRLSVYEAETEPLVAFYQPRGLVHSIDASGLPDVVAERIVKVLA